MVEDRSAASSLGAVSKIQDLYSPSSVKTPITMGISKSSCIAINSTPIPER